MADCTLQNFRDLADRAATDKTYKSYRDNKEPWSYNVQKRAGSDVQQKDVAWRVSSTDPLAAIAEMKEHPER